MKCLIIDDDATARLIIHQFCKKDIRLEVLKEFSDPIQALKYLNLHDVDLIFLDIHMPNFNGFDFIKTLKNPSKIILTTADKNFAIEAFEYDCVVDYLLKPIELSRFEKAINKAEKAKIRPIANTIIDKKEVSKNDFYVNIDRRLIKINLPSIYLIEAKGDYILIKTEDKNYTVHSTMKKIEDKLPDNLFLKIHRSFIINVKQIIDIEDNSVLIKKDVVPVSRSRRSELMQRLNLL